MSCILCGSENILPFQTYDTFSLGQCPDCKLIYQLNIEELDTLHLLYDTYNVHWIAMRDHAVRSTFGDHITFQLLWLEAFSPNKGRLLEIGSGTGEFIFAARQAGWEVMGIEPSPLSKAYAKYKYNVDLMIESSSSNVSSSSLEREEPSEKDFDVIVFWHVLEHIAEPLEFLKEMRTKLHPSGKIYCSVPNQNAFMNEVLGTSSPLYTEVDHLYHYSIANLKTLMAKAHLHIESIFTRQLPDAFYTLVDQHPVYQSYSFTERMALFAHLQSEQRGHEICCVLSRKE